MTSKEIGEALLERARANMELTSALTSGQPDSVVRERARALCALPSDPYHIAGQFFLMMDKLAKDEGEIGCE